MASNLAFDDVARNLLVFLKGQVPSLANKTDKDEIVRQVQSITFTLRSSIIQLEGAAYGDGSSNSDQTDLLNQIDELKKANAKLEESNQIEKASNRELRNQLTDIRDSLDVFENEKYALNTTIHLQKAENKRLSDENKTLKTELENTKSELQTKTLSSSQAIDKSVVINLKAELAELENELNDSRTDTAALKQALQNKEIEIRKSKEALMDAMNIDKSELENLKIKLQDFEKVQNENSSLKAQIENLQGDLKASPSQEEYQNNISALNTKVKFLEESLFNSQTQLKETQKQLETNNPDGIQKEKAALEQKVTSLESTLRSVIAAREAESALTKNTFTFNPDECIFLFETLSSLVRRLENSPENRDVYLRSKESISLLEKAKAVSKIQTLGHQLEPKLHKVTKAFRADFLPDEMIIHEEATGFVSGNKLIQKAVVWIAKSEFVCSECGKTSKPHELFCTQCGYELTAADGTSKREMPPFPTALNVNLPLLDQLMKQGNVKASTQLMTLISRVSPNNPEVVKKQAILSRVNPSFSMYPTY